MSEVEVKTIIASPSRTTVLWVSRHDPLPVQIQRLKEKLGEFSLIKVSGKIPSAQWLWNNVISGKVKAGFRVYVVPVLPLSFIAELCNLSKQHFQFFIVNTCTG